MVDRLEGYDNLLVVDGVPIIDQSKMERLLSKISKDFGRKGLQIKPDQMDVPWDATSGKSKGYLLIILSDEIFLKICVYEATSSWNLKLAKKPA